MFKQVKKVGKIRKMKAYGVIGVLAMGVLSGTNATSAFADEVVKPVDTPSPEAPKPAEESKPAEKTDAEKLAEVKENVRGVKDEINALSDTLREDKAGVDASTAEVARLNKEVEGIEASLAEATPEAVAEANKAIETAEAKETELTNSLPAVEASVPEAEKAKADLEATTATAKENVDTATTEVAKAEADVAEVNKSIATIESGGKGEELKTLKGISDTDKENLNTASVELETAVSELAKLKKETENAITDKGELEASLGEVEDAITEKNGKIAETRENVEKVNAEIAKLTEVINSGNSITVSPEYVEALRAYNKASNREERNKALEKLKEINQAMRDANVYKPSEADKAIVIEDVNNLTEDQLTDFSLYMSKLINDVRKQMGTTLSEVTPSSVNVSDTVTDNYVANKWSFTDVMNSGHDTNALNTSRETLGVNLDENLNTWMTDPNGGIPLGVLTMDKLKEMGYHAMLAFLFNGREWLHALSISGLNTDLYKREGQDWFSYVGADISVDEAGTRASIHVNEVNRSRDRELTDKFNRTPIANTYDTTEASNKLKVLNTTKEVFEGSVSTVEAEVAKLNERKAELKDGIKALSDKLALVEAKELLVGDKTNEVARLTETARASKEAYDRAVAESADLEATLRSLRENLSGKEATLAEKTSERNRLWGIYEGELAKLNTAKANYDKAVANVMATKLEIEKNKATAKTYKEKLAVWEKVRASLVAKQDLLKAKANVLKAKLDKTEEDLKKMKALELKLAEFVAEWKALEISVHGKVVSPELAEPVKPEVKPADEPKVHQNGKGVVTEDKPAFDVAKIDELKQHQNGNGVTTEDKPEYEINNLVGKDETRVHQNGKGIITEDKPAYDISSLVVDGDKNTTKKNQLNIGERVSQSTSIQSKTYSHLEKNHLPKTGTMESVSLTAIGTILSGLGVVGLRRKVK